MDEWPDTSDGMLTRQDREFLLGELDMEKYANPGAERQKRRHRIRKRVRAAILDFMLLNQFLPKKDADMIFEQVDPRDLSDPNAHALMAGARNSLAFWFYHMSENPQLQKSLVESAVGDALALSFLPNTHAELTVDMSVEVERTVSVDELEEKYEEGEDLTAKELQSLFFADRIDVDEYTERVALPGSGQN